MTSFTTQLPFYIPLCAVTLRKWLYPPPKRKAWWAWLFQSETVTSRIWYKIIQMIMRRGRFPWARLSFAESSWGLARGSGRCVGRAGAEASALRCDCGCTLPEDRRLWHKLHRPVRHPSPGPRLSHAHRWTPGRKTNITLQRGDDRFTLSRLCGMKNYDWYSLGCRYLLFYLSLWGHFIDKFKD